MLVRKRVIQKHRVMKGRCKSMREIIFKGKSIETGKWVYGDLLSSKTDNPLIRVVEVESYGYDENGMEVIEGKSTLYKVDKDTVCMYTGAFDAEGNKIFEGDILQLKPNDKYMWVTFEPDELMYEAINDSNTEYLSLDSCLAINSSVVVGNVYDNPDLLGWQYSA